MFFFFHFIRYCALLFQQHEVYVKKGKCKLAQVNSTKKQTSKHLPTCKLDSISTNLLKQVTRIILEILLNIVNSFLCLGHLPKMFKLAIIKPFIKNKQILAQDNWLIID